MSSYPLGQYYPTDPLNNVDAIEPNKIYFVSNASPIMNHTLRRVSQKDNNKYFYDLNNENKEGVLVDNHFLETHIVEGRPMNEVIETIFSPKNNIPKLSVKALNSIRKMNDLPRLVSINDYISSLEYPPKFEERILSRKKELSKVEKIIEGEKIEAKKRGDNAIKAKKRRERTKNRKELNSKNTPKTGGKRRTRRHTRRSKKNKIKRKTNKRRRKQ